MFHLGAGGGVYFTSAGGGRHPPQTGALTHTSPQAGQVSAPIRQIPKGTHNETHRTREGGYERVSYSVRLPPAKALRTSNGRVREGNYPSSIDSATSHPPRKGCVQPSRVHRIATLLAGRGKKEEGGPKTAPWFIPFALRWSPAVRESNPYPSV